MANNAKTVLKYSVFTSALTRALKGNGTCLHCNADESGAIYVTNGHFAIKLTVPEYDALIRPVSQRDAGNWALDEHGELANREPIDIAKILNESAAAAAHTITAVPMLFDPQNGSKQKLACYYSKTGDFVLAVNSGYASIVSPSLECKSSGSTSAMVAYAAEDPVALILPVNIKNRPEVSRAVRAWFVDESNAQQAETECGKLRRENEQLRQDYARVHIDAGELKRRIEELTAALASRNEQIEALTERLNAAPQPQEAPAKLSPQDKAAALAEKLNGLQGVTVTVKGAQTAAPVVWLSGDTDAHKTAIEKLGGLWSGKRSAWYFKIA